MTMSLETLGWKVVAVDNTKKAKMGLGKAPRRHVAWLVWDFDRLDQVGVVYRWESLDGTVRGSNADDWDHLRTALKAIYPEHEIAADPPWFKE